MARAAKARREDGAELDAVDLLHRLLVDRAVRLHGAAEVDAAAEERREARHAVVGAPVVADERGASRDLSLVGALEVRRDHVLTLREVRDRPEVDVERLDALPHERRQDPEAEHRKRDSCPDEAADADRREREERRAVDRAAEVRLGDDAELGLLGTGRAGQLQTSPAA